MEYQDKVNAKNVEALRLLTEKVIDLESKLTRVIKLVAELVEVKSESL
jgi:hypothetical protein